MNPAFDIEKFYLSGLCKRGHDYNGAGKSLRYIIGQDCVECKKYMESKRRKNNPQREFERQKIYREENKEKIRLHAQIYYIENKEIIDRHQAEYYATNTERIRIRHKAYYQKNKKHIRAKQNEADKQHCKNNTQIAIRRRLRFRVWKALDKYSRTGKIMSSKKYGIDYGAIIAHLGPHPNTLGLKGSWEIDHIIPLSRFDLNDPEQIILSFAPENLRWCPAKENWEKHAKIEGQLNLMTQKQLQAVL